MCFSRLLSSPAILAVEDGVVDSGHCLRRKQPLCRRNRNPEAVRSNPSAAVFRLLRRSGMLGGEEGEDLGGGGGGGGKGEPDEL